MKRLLITIAFTTFLISLNAQSLIDQISKSGRWSIVGYTGVARLDSDIDPDYDLSWILKSPTLDFSIEYNVHPIFALGFNLGGFIFNQGDVNEEFSTGGVHSNGFLSFDILGILNGGKSQKWSLWTNAGVGTAGLIWPEYTSTRTGAPALDPEIEGLVFPTAFMIFPLSLNLEYNLSKNVSLGAHFKYVYTNTDHLESSHRYYYNDQWETLAISLRYKFTPRNTKSVRDALAVADVPTIKQSDLDLLQNQINELANQNKNLTDQLGQLADENIVLAQHIDSCCNKIPEVIRDTVELIVKEEIPIPADILTNDSIDSDGDGVPDVRDLEPNTPPGTPVDFWGRSLNLDTLEEDDIPSVFFDFDSIVLDKESQITIEKVARKMQSDPSLMLEIRGYADNMGSVDYNRKLSQRRAEQVKQKLINKHHIPQDKIIANGKGKITYPPIKSRNNRRCDFFYSK